MKNEPASTNSDSGTFKFYSVADLIALPPPEWLIEGVIETKTLSGLYGPSGVFKSFAALDMALSVATGRPWQGRTVKKGRVLYVIGEGTAGAAKRVRAWMLYNGIEAVEDAFFLLRAPQVSNEADLKALMTALVKEQDAPALIVLDTFARCFVGGDENSAKDIGLFIQGCQRLQTQTGAAVLVIHHAGKPKGKKAAVIERGSSALRAAADVMIAQWKQDNLVLISNEKQKDDEEFKPIALRVKQIVVGSDLTGKPVTSCVLVDAGTSGPLHPAAPGMLPLNASEQFALNVLGGLGTAPSGVWHSAVASAKKATVPTKTFHNWRSALVERGCVETIPESPQQYRLTATGSAMAKTVLKDAA
jgi:putative DNA primase/helicase